MWADDACVSFLCACRFNIPGMNGREDWGRSEDDLMRARGAVDEVLTTLGLAPAHFDEHLRTRVSAAPQHTPVIKMSMWSRCVCASGQYSVPGFCTWAVL